MTSTTDSTPLIDEIKATIDQDRELALQWKDEGEGGSMIIWDVLECRNGHPLMREPQMVAFELEGRWISCEDAEEIARELGLQFEVA